jgi:DNA-binding transcriptional MocR family regulator
MSRPSRTSTRRRFPAYLNNIALTRAVVCRSEDVIVTAGAQQAFDPVGRLY